MYAGAASGAITLSLALFLIMLSQTPDASETQEPPPEPAVVKAPPVKARLPQAAVILPPPPAAALPTRAQAQAQQETSRPPLKPRTVDASVDKVGITPLSLRPHPVPPKPAARPAPAPAAGPDKPPPKRVATPPETAASPSPTAQLSNPVPVTRKMVKEGRALLKMLETGKGPVIEIAWPRRSADRSRLYFLLTSCYGMQTAMLADGQRLYAADTAPGQTWNVNRDAVSGFIRKPAGVLTHAERAVIHRITARHGAGDTVRLFPRGVDAVMLGGLGEIVGPGYLKYTTMRARYQLSGDRVTVVDIRVDGVNRPGTVALPKTSRCSV